MNLPVTVVPDDLLVAPDALEAALRATGVNGSALARRLHVDVGTVSRWRTGKSQLSRARFVAVLAVLGLPLDWRPPADGGAPTPAAPKGRPRARAAAAKGKQRDRRR